MEKLIITAAICGAEVTKEQNPAVPYTVEEMVREAKSAYEAGAAILHIHVREDDGTPTQGRERFRVVMDAIRKELPDVIMIPSTGGATGMSPEDLKKCREPYYTTKPTGIGLGLALSNELVLQNGGQMELESVLGDHTTIRLVFSKEHNA